MTIAMRFLVTALGVAALAAASAQSAAPHLPPNIVVIFADDIGDTTPHQVRIHARLEHAKRLLAGGNHSVTDVCLEVGFTSLGTFSDLFARRVGTSPSAYRKRFRRIAAVPALLRYQLYTPCFSLMAGPAGAAIFEKHSLADVAHWAGATTTARDSRQ